VPEDETSSENCLHCEINDVVREHIEGQEKVDIADSSRPSQFLYELAVSSWLQSSYPRRSRAEGAGDGRIQALFTHGVVEIIQADDQRARQPL